MSQIVILPLKLWGFNVFLTVHHELTIQYINYQLDALIIIYS